MDSFLSITCFSLTILKGTSSSPSTSRDAGSGIGPSMVHRFNSYLVRIKFSILDSEGTWPTASFASQYLLARAFPQLRMLCICSSVHESRSTDLTLLICVPMPRWMPEHRIQTKTPRFQEAHRGSKETGRSVMNLAHQFSTVAVSRTLVSLAIGADLVGLQLQETLYGSCVLRRPLSGGVRCSPGHD